MARHPGEPAREGRRTTAARRARAADLSDAAYARDMPPRDRVEAALRRLDYLAWKLGRWKCGAPR